MILLIVNLFFHSNIYVIDTNVTSLLIPAITCWTIMIHYYYRRLQDWTYSSVLHLHVITYQHCQYIKMLYPPKEHSKPFTLYYHQMEVHIPEINRLFHLLHLTNENEGICFTIY